MTSARDLWFGVLAALGFMAVVPAWIYFVNEYAINASTSFEFQWLITFSLPAALILFLAGWAEPRGN